MLVVISMHRSGSSLLAGLLCEKGLFAGRQESLIPATKDNQKGYFERRDIVDLNESIITDGYYNSAFPDFTNGVECSDEQVRKISRLSELLREEQVNIIKDPRFCLCLDEWKDSLGKICIVYLVRHPVSVALSLNKRQKYPLTSALALWEYYNYQALKKVEGLPVQFVQFESLIADVDGVSTEILEWYKNQSNLELSLDQDHLSGFYDKELVHNTQLESNLLTESQQRLYQFLSSGLTTYDGVHSSQSMLSVLRTTEEFVKLGYQPNRGLMIDEKSKRKHQRLKQRREEVIATNKKLRSEGGVISENNKLLRAEKKKLLNLSKYYLVQSHKNAERVKAHMGKTQALNKKLDRLIILRRNIKQFRRSRVGRVVNFYYSLISKVPWNKSPSNWDKIRRDLE